MNVGWYWFQAALADCPTNMPQLKWRMDLLCIADNTSGAFLREGLGFEPRLPMTHLRDRHAFRVLGEGVGVALHLECHHRRQRVHPCVRSIASRLCEAEAY